MYDYLDRPVAQLDRAERLLLGAMRQWVAMARSQRCPCSVLAPALAAHGVAPMLHDLNMAMLLLDRDGVEKLSFKPVGCDILSDDEAMLLWLHHATRTGAHGRVTAVVDQMLKPQARHPMIVALDRIATILAQ